MDSRSTVGTRSSVCANAYPCSAAAMRNHAVEASSSRATPTPSGYITPSRFCADALPRSGRTTVPRQCQRASRSAVYDQLVILITSSSSPTTARQRRPVRRRARSRTDPRALPELCTRITLLGGSPEPRRGDRVVALNASPGTCPRSAARTYHNMVTPKSRPTPRPFAYRSAISCCAAALPASARSRSVTMCSFRNVRFRRVGPWRVGPWRVGRRRVGWHRRAHRDRRSRKLLAGPAFGDRWAVEARRGRRSQVGSGAATSDACGARDEP